MIKMIVFLLGSISCLAIEQNLILQQGLDGYLGVEDTWISTSSWANPPQYSVNYGQNEHLTLGRDNSENPLIRFLLTSIPENSVIVSAHLELYNTTESSQNGLVNFSRRVKTYRILADWDEGNQVNSPADSTGKHGATGDFAFDYFPGEGTDMPWSARGMDAGIDYAAEHESFSDVINPGWYTWDLTEMVRFWVRNPAQNFGCVLKDATGYADNHIDWRDFISSQNGNMTLRPRLVIVYNPDVPYADAGADQEDLQWSGNALILDGSASHDRAGGNNNTLVYEWRIAQAAFGSQLGAVVLANTQMASFTPDHPGVWEIELTVTNDILEVATDTTLIRVLQIGAHPRIYLTPAKTALLQSRILANTQEWTRLLAEAGEPDSDMQAKALVGLLTGQSSYCDTAIQEAIDLMNGPIDYSEKAGDIAVVYDWCFDQLTTPDRDAMITYFNSWAQSHIDNPPGDDIPGWGNYWPRYAYSFAMVGLATFNENPEAQTWFDRFRHDRFEQIDRALLDRIADGGAWPEGMIYDWIANPARVKTLDAWQTATGENLFLSSTWFQNRFAYFLLHRFPGVADNWGRFFHPYGSTGDTERNRGAMTQYDRVMNLILIEQFPDHPLARQLQAYLTPPQSNTPWPFLYHEEFLWFNPAQAEEPPVERTHYSPSTGTIFMRSGWPDGAADTDPGVTHVTFQCGDHFSYHQHYDQNSFTLFKYSEQASDSGVYSGDGLSFHDANYYVRTIAHNTLVVYNPLEDFSASRPDAISNDGGQRSMSPASRAPGTMAYVQQYQVQYDTGTIQAYLDRSQFTYALGDATSAYNNPTYNQAMDAALTGNVAKVTRFQREFLYLRPPIHGAQDYVILYDRVGVTDPLFSGANTKLLFHLKAEPLINGTANIISPGETLFVNADRVTADDSRGKLFFLNLKPNESHIRKVGGRGDKAFWVFDQNYDWHWNSNEPQPRPVNDFETDPYSEWRIEIEPANTALDHNFLHVLVPTVSGTSSIPTIHNITGTGMEGVHILDPDEERAALFSSDLNGAAPLGNIEYTLQPLGAVNHFLFDLTPGFVYRLQIVNTGLQTVTLIPDPTGTLMVSSQGHLSFQTHSIGCLAVISPLLPNWPETTILDFIQACLD